MRRASSERNNGQRTCPRFRPQFVCFASARRKLADPSAALPVVEIAEKQFLSDTVRKQTTPIRTLDNKCRMQKSASVRWGILRYLNRRRPPLSHDPIFETPTTGRCHEPLD